MNIHDEARDIEQFAPKALTHEHLFDLPVEWKYVMDESNNILQKFVSKFRCNWCEEEISR